MKNLAQFKNDKRVKLFLSDGDTDYLGKVWKENRYIVLEDGMDVYGDHMSIDEVQEFIAENHALVIEVGTYHSREIAEEIRDRNNNFFIETNQHYDLVAVLCPIGGEIYSIKIFRL